VQGVEFALDPLQLDRQRLGRGGVLRLSCRVELGEIGRDPLGDVRHGVHVEPDVLVESVDVRVALVLVGMLVIVLVGMLVVGDDGIRVVVRELRGRDDDGIRAGDQLVHERVVSAAVLDDEVGLLHRETIAGGRLVSVRILRGGVDHAGDLDPISADLRRELTVDVGRGDDLQRATVRIRIAGGGRASGQGESGCGGQGEGEQTRLHDRQSKC